MNDLKRLHLAELQIATLEAECRSLERQLLVAQSMAATLEAECHTCPDGAHHKGWWESTTDAP